MNIKDELHDLRLVGWRDYWWLAYGQRWEMRRADRREKRLIESSTWDALTETLDEDERNPYEWPQIEFEATMTDVIAVEKRRWIERAAWITVAVAMAGAGLAVGLYFHEQTKPEPWDCMVSVAPENLEQEPTIMRCVGGEMP